MATAAEQISQIYVGYFNRAPDPAGLQYWITQLNNGMPLGEIADYFATEQETLDLYPYLRQPDLNSVDDFINEIYANLFNRPADAAGLAFWKGQLESGAVSEGEFIAAIANGATGEGRLVLDNKVAVGVYFATELSQNNVVWDATALDAAYQALAGVTLDPASVIEAQAEIDTFVDTGAWPGTVGETYTLTTGVDDIVGTAGNDTVQGVIGAPSPTFTTLDSIDGAAGVNTLNLVVQGLVGTQAALPGEAVVSVKNIQVVNLVSENGAIAASGGAAINAAVFGDELQQLWQLQAGNDVEGLQDGQTAGFGGNVVFGAGGGNPLEVSFEGTEASIALEGVASGSTFAVLGNDVETASISGTVAGAGVLSIAGLGGSTTTVNLAMEAFTNVGLAAAAVTQIRDVEVIDGSASTGGLNLQLVAGVLPALSLESLSTGSGNDVVSLAVDKLTAADVSVDLGAGKDFFAVDFGAVPASLDTALSITTGAGRDIIAFGDLTLNPDGVVTAAAAAGNLIVNGQSIVGGVTIEDFASAEDVLQIAQFTGFTTQNLVDDAVETVVDAGGSLVQALTAVQGVLSGVASGITDYAQFVFDGNTYVYGDLAAGLDGDLLIELTGVVALNDTNVSGVPV